MQIEYIGQKSNYDCGSAVAAMLLNHNGLSRKNPKPCKIDGLHPISLESHLRNCGLDVLSGSMFPNVVRSLIKDGLPVACLTKDYDGHWVLVTRWTNTKVYYHDPAIGPDCVKSASQFFNDWYCEDRYSNVFIRYGVCCWTLDNHLLVV